MDREYYKKLESYQHVVRLAEEVLQDNDVREKAVPAKDVIDRIESHSDAPALAFNTIYAFLSFAANHDDNTGLESGGPRGGYWLNKAPQLVPQTEPAPIPKPTAKEKHLYDLVRFWFATIKNIPCKDISQLKSGGKWGNPDLIGISATERVGLLDIEIVSSEVKLSDDDWRQYIFEAISHKRFANRTLYI